MSKIVDVIANNWVSWMLELIVLSVIAFYTINENKKTQEHTRQMITNFETKITAYASDKAKALDDAALAAKAEVKNVFKPDGTSFMDRAKKLLADKESKQPPGE